ncbi:MAG: hypothetical protein P4M11_16045 [Candidatus Pacebacteria bacterium]|nr:hypothetical protein [Candidatus Paceibacterota bacterium]
MACTRMPWEKITPEELLRTALAMSPVTEKVKVWEKEYYRLQKLVEDPKHKKTTELAIYEMVQ